MEYCNLVENQMPRTMAFQGVRNLLQVFGTSVVQCFTIMIYGLALPRFRLLALQRVRTRGSPLYHRNRRYDEGFDPRTTREGDDDQ